MVYDHRGEKGGKRGRHDGRDVRGIKERKRAVERGKRQ